MRKVIIMLQAVSRTQTNGDVDSSRVEESGLGHKEQQGGDAYVHPFMESLRKNADLFDSDGVSDL